MIVEFHRHIQQLIPAGSKLLLAVSGGVDSVVLADLLHRCRFDIEIAHCNFQLRGEESERDEGFVRELAADYKVPVHVKRFETAAFAAQEKCSIQEAARILRYQWFDELVASQGKDRNAYIVTAHHADDNIETVLMRLFRGTGLQGLTGIPPIDKERRLLRPLLPFRKEELKRYADENAIDYVEDSSNAADKYTRNFFRNRLLPQIREVFPQANENLAASIDRFRDAHQLYTQAVQRQLDSLIEHRQDELHVPVLKLKKSAALQTIAWELIKPFGFGSAQVPEVVKLLDAVNGSSLASPTHRIIRNRNWLIITPQAPDTSQHILIEPGEEKILFEHGTLYLNEAPFVAGKDTDEAFVNPAMLRYPLLLRRWKPGDYFYPLGMQKKKKLNRFFIDLKLSPTEKEKVWVIESDKRIVWVIGHRIDNRFRITDAVTPALRITCSRTR